MNFTKSNRRMKISTTVFVMILALYIGVLAVNVTSSGDGAVQAGLSKYNIVVEAARGEILDRNGATLVSNRQGHNIQFNAAVFPAQSEKTQRGQIIAALIELCESKDEEWNDNLPIVYDDNGLLVFAENRETDIAGLKKKNMLNLNPYATADNCLDALIDMYRLEDYDRVTARKIASVLYEMWRTGFSVTQPYTFAKDVSNETVSIIMEKSEFFKGVEANVETYREYTDGTIAPHIIGVTGIISSEEYDSRKKELDEKTENSSLSKEELDKLTINSYTLTDYVGKFGIESAMENHLRGEKGIKTISIDENKNVSGEFTVNPKQGDTVVLTIDSGLQRVAQNALQKRILELSATNGTSLLAPAGAVVVLDVNSGDILASASYPSYDITEYYSKYNDLLKEKGTPLVNRVLQSAYEPGSTMKLSTALAGLESNVIDKDSLYYCNSVFQYYDVPFSCLSAHGNINVVTALEKSCNIYFYNVSNLLGIDVMNDYSKKLGLGQKTGVELGESAGILAGRAYRSSIGSTWQMGDTIQAGIGQSDNLFTILQLANYVATIANNGTRYKCHYVKYITSADRNEVIYEVTPEIVEKTGISKQSIDIVKEGMLAVTTTGSCRTAFAPIKEKVGAKTGTTQVKRIINGQIVRGNNGLNVSFAPFDNPEIAVAVIIENVDSGTATATVAADIYEYYFATKNQISSLQPVNELLR